MSNLKLFLVFTLSFFHIFFFNCNLYDGYFADLGDLSELNNKITKEYNVESVNINLHNEISLRISLINSKFNKLEKPKKIEKSKEILKYTISNYKHAIKLDSIIITFSVYKNYAGCSYKNSLDSYRYKKENNKWIYQEEEEAKLEIEEGKFQELLRKELEKD